MSQIHIVITFIYIIHLNVDQVLSIFSPPVVSNSCMDLGICETVENYPTELARKLVKELKDNNALIADDPIISTTQKPRQPNEERFLYRVAGGSVYRSGVDDDIDLDEGSQIEENFEIPLCTSTVQYQRPKIAENRNNTWKFILNNDDERPFQTFRTERCNSRHSKCSEEMNFISNYKGVCVQRWILKEMYYIKDDNTFGKDYFKVPSCCACRLFHRNK